MDQFLSLTLLSVLMVMSPGPAFAVTVDQSLKHGKRAGIMTALGITLGDLFHIAVNLLGLSVLIMNAPKVMFMLQCMGALYFIYIGIVGVCAGRVDAFDQSPPEMRGTQSFQRGLLVGVMNIKAMFFYLNFFAVMMPLGASLLMKVSYGMWVLCIVMIWFSVVALTLNHKSLRLRFLAQQHWIKRACGVALCYFGTRLLLGIVMS